MVAGDPSVLGQECDHPAQTAVGGWNGVERVRVEAEGQLGGLCSSRALMRH